MVKITNHKYKHEMKLRNIGSMESSELVTVAALFIILAGMYFARTIVAPILLALFISIVCAQPITWLKEKGFPGWIGLILVALGLVTLFLRFTFLIGGTLSYFASNVSKYDSTLSEIGHSMLLFLSSKGIDLPDNQFANFMQSAKILEYTSTVLKELLRLFGNSFLIFLIILFMLMEFTSLVVKAKAVLGLSIDSVTYLSTITKNMRHYLGIKTLICFSIGLLIYVALKIIGVDYPLLWAFLAGLMNYIPNIGSVFATIPAVLFALVQIGLGGALWTLGAFVIIHNVLGNFIEPKIMGRGLGLSALVVLLSLLFWGFILGPVGMFLSVPFTMSLKVILEQNDKTRWMAILLGTSDEADTYLKQQESSRNQVRGKTVHLKRKV